MSHVEREATITAFWKEKKIFEKSVSERPKDKQYVFYDGPPFATGTPHYGHILGLTSKDLFPRYWTMKGYRVERRWGWDCHGLPIENIAEKELGTKEKKDIEAMGIAKFNNICRDKVLGYADDWKIYLDRMGKWIEYDNSYKTMDNSYMETVWWIFKELHTQGYVYEGRKVLMFCPRCETPLAKAEVAMDKSYKNVTERTATAKFKLVDEDNTYLLAWTTTPWTLIGNASIAASSTLMYVKIKVGEEYFILAKDTLKNFDKEYEIVATFPGKDLLNKKYEPLYKLETDKEGHYVVDGGEEVNAEEGTGLIHMAAYGEFDYEMIKKHDLPVFLHIGEQGKLIEGKEEWKGLWFKKVDKEVLKDLEERNLLFDSEDYTHAYPFCYRCDTPLLYYPVTSWFFNVQKIKPKLLERNEDINWSVKHLKHGMFQNIISSAPDWTVSRNRYWATSMPVWKCDDCEHVEIIGSVKELQEKAVEEVQDDVDLHKHVMDDIHLKCSCGKQMSRIPEVFDCWVDSAAMPYAAKHYPFENKEWFQHHFPADFISEYIGQTRAWFYYMHVIGVLLFDKAPFKNVVVTGNILAEDGAKMSKSKKNYPEPTLIFDNYGGDALRFYLMASPLMKAEDLNFREDGVKEVYRKVVMLLDNVRKFYALFGEENRSVSLPSSQHVLDKWIVSRVQITVRDVTHALDTYDTIVACSAIQKLIEELSTWYVRRSRDRFKSSNNKDAVETLAYSLYTVSLLLAPIAPFVTESVQQMFKQFNVPLTESVHLEMWPEFNREAVDEVCLEKMKDVRKIVSKALELREKAGIPIRQALSTLHVQGVDLAQEYLDLIKDELNVKAVVVEEGEELVLDLDTNITKELLLEGIAREIIRKVNNLRKKEGLTIKDRIDLYFVAEGEVQESFEVHKEHIMQSVQADGVEFTVPNDVSAKDVKVNKISVKIGLKKLE